MSMPRVAPVLLFAASACANAGGSSPPVDSWPVDAPRRDAQVLPDAPVDGPLIDAPSIDAPMPDAPDDGLFCTANSQCTVAGECCIKLTLPQGICGPGTVFLGECIPE